MKRYAWILLAMTGLSLALIGCGKNSQVDTSKLVSSFKSSAPAVQSDVDKVVSDVKAGNYNGAMNDLKNLSRQAKLTPEQQQAIQDTMAAIQKQLAGAASQAAGQLQKSLPK